MAETNASKSPIAKRFRGYYPVVIDVETGGFDARKDALLELAAVTVAFDDAGKLQPHNEYHYHIEPYPGMNLDPKALAFTGIQPYHPFRFAVSEKDALTALFKAIRQDLKEFKCQRAVLVGHNPLFDLGFLQAAISRNKIKREPFHSFTTFDTATLGALVYGQTVLARIAAKAKIEFDANEAHSAIYDAKKTAEIFCQIVNLWPLETDVIGEPNNE